LPKPLSLVHQLIQNKIMDTMTKKMLCFMVHLSAELSKSIVERLALVKYLKHPQQVANQKV